jgi:hypothetical protein
MALLAIPTSRYDGPIQAGIDYLLSMQHDGTWHEPQYTGTGFPGYGVGSRLQGELHQRTVSIQQGLEVGRGFMINYNLYRHYFPLMALSRARSRIESREQEAAVKSIEATQLRSLAELGFVTALPAAEPGRRRSRGGIVAGRLFRKTAKFLARKSRKRSGI